MVSEQKTFSDYLQDQLDRQFEAGQLNIYLSKEDAIKAAQEWLTQKRQEYIKNNPKNCTAVYFEKILFDELLEELKQP